MEQNILSLDCLNVGVTGHRPERIEPFRMGNRQWRFAAQLNERLIDTIAIGIGGRVDNGVGNVLRNGRQGSLP